MAVKAVVDRAKALPGYLGMAVYAGDRELYNESIDSGYVKVLLGLLRASPGARQASALVGGLTIVAFYAGDYVVLLKVAGRFPALPGVSPEEPDFIDPSCAPALPSQAEARREAEAALRQFGLLQ